MQGRSAQRFWDALEDDREWDIPVAISPTGTAEGARIVGEGEVQPGVYPLDVNARHRLAVARIKMGDINEGRVCSGPCADLARIIHTLSPQMHANIVLSQDIAEYAALFSEIADAYFERELYEDAAHIYEMLGADAGVRTTPPTVQSLLRLYADQ